MTTPSEEAVTRLAGALRAFDEAGGIWHGWAADGDTKYTATGFAAAILAADPQLAAAIELGLAWAEAEAALPEGFVVAEVTKRWYDGDCGTASWKDEWQALAGGTQDRWDGDFAYGESATGPTPAAALRALAEKLR